MHGGLCSRGQSRSPIAVMACGSRPLPKRHGLELGFAWTLLGASSLITVRWPCSCLWSISTGRISACGTRCGGARGSCADGAAAGQRSYRAARLLRQDQPRDPHAAQRHHRDDAPAVESGLTRWNSGIFGADLQRTPVAVVNDTPADSPIEAGKLVLARGPLAAEMRCSTRKRFPAALRGKWTPAWTARWLPMAEGRCHRPPVVSESAQ